MATLGPRLGSRCAWSLSQSWLTFLHDMFEFLLLYRKLDLRLRNLVYFLFWKNINLFKIKMSTLMFWKLTWKTFWKGKSQKLAKTGAWGIELVFGDSLICDTFLLSFATVSLHFRWHIPGPFAAIPYGRILFHPSLYVCVHELVKHEEYMPQIITSWAPALPRPETVKRYLFWYARGFFLSYLREAICIGFYAKVVSNFRTINNASVAAVPWQNASETRRQALLVQYTRSRTRSRSRSSRS